MTAASTHEFFAASAGVAGALIGLLFVAVSVAPERILGPNASEVHGLRAAATLSAFTNALVISLFGLIPGIDVGGTAIAVALVGLLFMCGAVVRVLEAWRAQRVKLREVTFLIGLLVVFVIQLIAGLALEKSSGDANDLQTICVLVVVCFLIGIERAWELVGGPSFAIVSVLMGRLGRQRDEGARIDTEERKPRS